MSHSADESAARPRQTPHTMKHELLEAVATGNKDLLAQVLGLGSNAVSTATAEQGDQSCLKGVTAQGSSALHIAASHGYLELVQMICTRDVSLMEARNNLRDTPLICAARAGHGDVVGYLIKQALAGQEAEDPVLRAKNLDGATAMHEAVRNGHVVVLQKLMMTDSGLAAVVDGKDVSPLYLAVASLRTDIVDILIAESPDGVKSRASYAGPDGQTALHVAVHDKGNFIVDIPFFGFFTQELSESLCRWEPTLTKKVDKFGRTALHYAASAGRSGVVKLLLEDKSIAYIPDSNGLFPVHTAAIMGKADVIHMFMEICPNCDELLDNKGRNFLHCAVEHGRDKVVRQICRKPKFVRMLNARDGEGNTPLHLAVKHGYLLIFLLLVTNIRVELSSTNNEGLTPLDVAIDELDRCCYTFSLWTRTFISWCLTLCVARRSPRHVQAGYYLTDELSKEVDKEESIKYTNASQSLLCISVFIATGSFTVAFTVPGGHIAEGDNAGMPVLGGKEYFRNLINANTWAFIMSAAATCLLVHASLTIANLRNRRYYLVTSVIMVYEAVMFMLLSFVNAVRLTLVPTPTDGWANWDILGLAIVFASNWPMLAVAAVVYLRFGMRGLRLRDRLLGTCLTSWVAQLWTRYPLPFKTMLILCMTYALWIIFIIVQKRHLSQVDATLSHPT